MIWKDFPEVNRQLKAGNNPHTKSLPVSICHIPGMAKNLNFFISKWELTDEEKVKQRQKFLEVIQENPNLLMDIGKESVDNQFVDLLMEALQPVYLSAMHTPPPVAMFGGGNSPFDHGFVPKELPPPPVDPKDN